MPETLKATNDMDWVWEDFHNKAEIALNLYCRIL